MAKMTIGGGAKEKGVKGPRIKCETETSQTTQAAQTVLATMEAAAGVVLPVKKKRGRAKKVVVDAIPTTKLTPRPTTTPHTYAASTKSPSSSELQLFFLHKNVQIFFNSVCFSHGQNSTRFR